MASLPKSPPDYNDWKTLLSKESKESLKKAYQHCEQLIYQNSHSFYLASALLPEKKRLAARALYAFCRITDNIVDVPDQEPFKRLEEWRKETLTPRVETKNPVILAWLDTCCNYQIPKKYADQLIVGVGRDLEQHTYQTFEEMVSYCYGVASTVGLMSMHIIGFQGQEAFSYAIKLGVALQITNILRDISEDFRAGYIYLPQEELNSFKLSSEDLEKGEVTSEWRQFMRFQIDRNQKLYQEAWPGIGLLSKEGRFSIAAAAEFYRGILGDIENHNYDVFSRRSYVSRWKKLRKVPEIWWRSRNPMKRNIIVKTPTP